MSEFKAPTWAEIAEIYGERAARLKQETQLAEMLEIANNRPRQPAQSTIDAYKYLRSYAPERLAAWLESHAEDAPFLTGLGKTGGTDIGASAPETQTASGLPIDRGADQCPAKAR